jgi:2-polyprenyl-3-methyl-5-hydroxy-6-metoxy-1,4-benzoquinol methylase
VHQDTRRPAGTHSAGLDVGEREWWNRFGQLNEEVWQYNPALHRMVRSGYLAEMEAFLFHPGGRVLDVGCGHGWVGLRLAARGMRLDGIDLSEVQVARARQRAAAMGATEARFWRADACDLADDPDNAGRYDSSIVHALLHHLPEDAQIALLEALAQLLRPGGRAYLYEPVAAAPGAPWPVALVDKALGGLLRTLTVAARRMGIVAQRFRTAQQAGWTMLSPGEAPVDLERLLACLPAELDVVDVRLLHAYAVMYANLCMQLRQPWQDRAAHLVPLFVGLDRAVLRQPWARYLRAWPMAGVMLEKKA